MTSTATQLIIDALNDLCVIRPGQVPTADILAVGLRAANQMIDQWLLNQLMVQTQVPNIYPLVSGQQDYTIGPTGCDFTAPRPTEIENANVVLNTVTPVLRVPLNILVDPGSWAAIAVQHLPNALPLVLWYEKSLDQTTGGAKLHLWPGPLVAYGLELYTWQQLTSFADLTTSYLFPPGYVECMRKNLAVKVAPMLRAYFKVPPDLFAELKEQALQAMNDLQSYNAPDPMLTEDPAFIGARPRAGWNYLLGTYGRNNR